MRSKWIILGSVLAGLVLAAYALNSVMPRRHSDLSMLRPTGSEFLADDYASEFRKAKGRGTEETLSLVQNRVLDLALRDTTLDGGDAEDIADRVCEHLRFIIEPDYDGWIELARLYVPNAGYNIEGEPDSIFREKWEWSAESLAGAPVAVDGIQIRTIEDPMAFPKERSEPGTIILSCANTSAGGADYPAIVGGRLRAREILVPVVLESGEGSRIPVMLGMRFSHSDRSGTWRPARMFVYLGPGGFGSSFRAPVF